MGSNRATSTGQANAAGLEPLLRCLRHDFTDSSLLRMAVTHGSAPSRLRDGGDYQRLEFIGDRVLGLVMAEKLYHAFPREPEGALTRRFAGLVRKETLAEVAREIGLGRYIVLSKSEEELGGRDNPAILADCCEALIGALYLDGGLEAARRFIEAQWKSLVAADLKPPQDSKTALQEWAQARGRPLPSYREVAREGPDHDPEFTIEVEVQKRAGARAGGEEGFTARGRGRSKRLAEQEAAAKLLSRLKDET